MRLSGVGVEQLSQLSRALVAADADLQGNPESLPRPLCFGLAGTLGAGKTRLSQEIAQAWGIDPAEVTSPTFTLLKTYEIESRPHSSSPRRQLHHLDLYRIVDEDELWELGIDELWETPGSWTLVEWADRFADCMPSDTIWIKIEISDDPVSDVSVTDDDSTQPPRDIEIQSSDPQNRDWLLGVESRLGDSDL